MTAPAPERGTELEVTPQEFGLHGDAVAHDLDGRVLSVPGAIPGERVRVKVLARRRGVAHARVVDVIDPSPDRVGPPCPELARGCGACQWQHIDLDAQQAYKRRRVADALGLSGASGHSRLRSTVQLPPTDFRTTVHVGVKDGRAGFHRYRSHRLVPVDACLVAHPLLEDLIVHGAYGSASEVLLRCGARTGERVAVPTPSEARMELPIDVGRDRVHEIAAGHEWRISARSFFQTRPDGVDALATAVTEATDEMEPKRSALDLYSGVGVFAAVLAARGWFVTAVESEPSAVEDARVNLGQLDVKIIRADVNRWKPPNRDLVVADPSRAGLGRRGVDVVAATGADRVILISCDAASLGRDAILLGRAGYTISYATPIDLFPHTFHVEVVSVFDR